ncbi:MAG: EVE domain-containing protein [Bacteroidetes bacterium]|nr:EVE domain-containing protein [Bacteroidota bacterium]
MNYWLVKSEPNAFSWQQFVADGKTIWDGVRNYQARNNLMEMKKDDLVLFYHSVSEKQVVGIAKVSREHFPDPTIEDKRWVVVEMVPNKELAKPVSLEQIKNEKKLSELALVKQSRLSVMPLTKEQFDLIVGLGKV